jgi:hypothetical protein
MRASRVGHKNVVWSVSTFRHGLSLLILKVKRFDGCNCCSCCSPLSGLQPELQVRQVPT